MALLLVTALAVAWAWVARVTDWGLAYAMMWAHMAVLCACAESMV